MLNVDKFFTHALRTSEEVMQFCEGRIFNPDRPEIDEEEDGIPYINVRYEGGASSGDTKDSILSRLDSATVSVLIVATDRNELGLISEAVEERIAEVFEDETLYDEHDDWNFYIEDCSVSAGAVEMDIIPKECHYQTLTYQCNTSKR